MGFFKAINREVNKFLRQRSGVSSFTINRHFVASNNQNTGLDPEYVKKLEQENMWLEEQVNQATEKENALKAQLSVITIARNDSAMIVKAAQTRISELDTLISSERATTEAVEDLILATVESIFDTYKNEDKQVKSFICYCLIKGVDKIDLATEYPNLPEETRAAFNKFHLMYLIVHSPQFQENLDLTIHNPNVENSISFGAYLAQIQRPLSGGEVSAIAHSLYSEQVKKIQAAKKAAALSEAQEWLELNRLEEQEALNYKTNFVIKQTEEQRSKQYKSQIRDIEAKRKSLVSSSRNKEQEFISKAKAEHGDITEIFKKTSIIAERIQKPILDREVPIHNSNVEKGIRVGAELAQIQKPLSGWVLVSEIAHTLYSEQTKKIEEEAIKSVPLQEEEERRGRREKQFIEQALNKHDYLTEFFKTASIIAERIEKPILDRELLIEISKKSKAGFDIDARDVTGHNYLHHLILNGNKIGALEAIKAGANTSEPFPDGATIFHKAAEYSKDNSFSENSHALTEMIIYYCSRWEIDHKQETYDLVRQAQSSMIEIVKSGPIAAEAAFDKIKKIFILSSRTLTHYSEVYEILHEILKAAPHLSNEAMELVSSVDIGDSLRFILVLKEIIKNDHSLAQKALDLIKPLFTIHGGNKDFISAGCQLAGDIVSADPNLSEELIQVLAPLLIRNTKENEIVQAASKALREMVTADPVLAYRIFKLLQEPFLSGGNANTSREAMNGLLACARAALPDHSLAENILDIIKKDIDGGGGGYHPNHDSIYNIVKIAPNLASKALDLMKSVSTSSRFHSYFRNSETTFLTLFEIVNVNPSLKEEAFKIFPSSARAELYIKELVQIVSETPFLWPQAFEMISYQNLVPITLGLNNNYLVAKERLEAIEGIVNFTKQFPPSEIFDGIKKIFQNPDSIILYRHFEKEPLNDTQQLIYKKQSAELRLAALKATSAMSKIASSKQLSDILGYLLDNLRDPTITLEYSKPVIAEIVLLMDKETAFNEIVRGLQVFDWRPEFRRTSRYVDEIDARWYAFTELIKVNKYLAPRATDILINNLEAHNPEVPRLYPFLASFIKEIFILNERGPLILSNIIFDLLLKHFEFCNAIYSNPPAPKSITQQWALVAAVYDMKHFPIIISEVAKYNKLLASGALESIKKLKGISIYCHDWYNYESNISASIMTNVPLGLSEIVKAYPDLAAEVIDFLAKEDYCLNKSDPDNSKVFRMSLPLSLVQIIESAPAFANEALKIFKNLVLSNNNDLKIASIDSIAKLVKIVPLQASKALDILDEQFHALLNNLDRSVLKSICDAVVEIGIVAPDSPAEAFLTLSIFFSKYPTIMKVAAEPLSRMIEIDSVSHYSTEFNPHSNLKRPTENVFELKSSEVTQEVKAKQEIEKEISQDPAKEVMQKSSQGPAPKIPTEARKAAAPEAPTKAQRLVQDMTIQKTSAEEVAEQILLNIKAHNVTINQALERNFVKDISSTLKSFKTKINNKPILDSLIQSSSFADTLIQELSHQLETKLSLPENRGIQTMNHIFLKQIFASAETALRSSGQSYQKTDHSGDLEIWNISNITYNNPLLNILLNEFSQNPNLIKGIKDKYGPKALNSLINLSEEDSEQAEDLAVIARDQGIESLLEIFFINKDDDVGYTQRQNPKLEDQTKPQAEEEYIDITEQTMPEFCLSLSGGISNYYENE